MIWGEVEMREGEELASKIPKKLWGNWVAFIKDSDDLKVAEEDFFCFCFGPMFSPENGERLPYSSSKSAEAH